MGPHGSWTRAFHETLGHTLYWIAAFIILAGALSAYTRYDQRRRRGAVSAMRRDRSQSPNARESNADQSTGQSTGESTDPSSDLPPDD